MSKSMTTVGDLKQKLDEFPDNMPVYILKGQGWYEIINLYTDTDEGVTPKSLIIKSEDPEHNQVLDALKNMSGAFDTPVERRRRPFSPFQEEAVASMRTVLRQRWKGTEAEDMEAGFQDYLKRQKN